jgi:hypothetical protein
MNTLYALLLALGVSLGVAACKGDADVEVEGDAVEDAADDVEDAADDVEDAVD